MIVVAVALVATVYEIAALVSRGRLTTITAWMQRLPVWGRLLIVGVFAVLMADHFTVALAP